MSWFTLDLNQKTCLTCQHFKGCHRKLQAVGRTLQLQYDSTQGVCGIFKNFPLPICNKAGMTSTCHYTRWRELP